MFLQLLLRVGQALCVLLGLVIARSLWFLLQCWKARIDYARSKVPGPPPSRSPFGHLSHFADNQGPWELAKLSEQYGPLFKLQMLTSVRFFLTDPAAIQQVSKKSGSGPYLPKPRELYWPMERMTRPHLPNILTAADGPYWKAVRQGTAPCFSINNMKKVLPLIVELTKRAADKMSETTTTAAAAGAAVPAAVVGVGGVTFDVSDAAKRITSDVMGQLLLGEDLQGTRWKESEYLVCFNKSLVAMDALFVNPLHFWQRFWDADVADQYRALKRHDIIMTQKMNRLLQKPPPEYTIAAHLLSIQDPATRKPLILDQLKAEASIFMGAGFETTSHAISWTLALLSIHQDSQQLAFEELKSLGLTTRDVAAADLGNMPYTSAVIKESMRLCPPNPWGGNKVTTEQETDILGYKLPKGAYIETPLLPLALLERNYGKDALLFKPERWLQSTHPAAATAAEAPAGAQKDYLASTSTLSSSSSSSAKSPAAVSPQVPPDPLTFMVGPRDCLGQSLAKIELQVVLAVLLSRFRFYPGPKLAQELKIAEGLGQAPLKAVHAVADVHVTMQPVGGKMLLDIAPRA